MSINCFLKLRIGRRRESVCGVYQNGSALNNTNKQHKYAETRKHKMWADSGPPFAYHSKCLYCNKIHCRKLITLKPTTVAGHHYILPLQTIFQLYKPLAHHGNAANLEDKTRNFCFWELRSVLVYMYVLLLCPPD